MTDERVEYRDQLREIDSPMTAAQLTDLHRTEGWMLMGVANASVPFPGGLPHTIPKLIYYFARKVR